LLDAGTGGDGVRASSDGFLGLAAGDRGVFALEEDLGESARGGAGGEGFAAFEGAAGCAAAEGDGEKDRE